MKKLTFLLAALAIVMACNKESDELASAKVGNNESIVDRSTKVFKATMQSSLNLNPPVTLTLCAGDIPEFAIPDHFLAGQATHLGKLDGTLSTLHHDACHTSVSTATLSASVSGQLTGSNGDQIFYSGEDVIDISGLLPTPSSPSGAINGSWTITGGTGKFIGASGSITISGIVDYASGTFNAEANGTISY